MIVPKGLARGVIGIDETMIDLAQLAERIPLITLNA